MLLQHTWEMEQMAPGRWLGCVAYLRQCPLQTTTHLRCLDLGRAQNGCPGKSVPLQSTQEPELLKSGKCTKCRAHFGQCPCRAPWSQRSGDPRGTCHFDLGQTQCGLYTVSTPHTCHLFTVSLPSHNTTEQVSPNKWPHLPPCVRAEIRHWRDV